MAIPCGYDCNASRPLIKSPAKLPASISGSSPDTYACARKFIALKLLVISYFLLRLAHNPPGTMSYLAGMKLLINLAKADGQIADREKNFLINIGRANGIFPDELYPLLTQNHENIVPENLSDDEKFELLFSLIQLMKLDERMYREEIAFCGEVATRLGCDRNVMFELLARVKPSTMAAADKLALKQITNDYLQKD